MTEEIDENDRSAMAQVIRALVVYRRARESADRWSKPCRPEAWTDVLDALDALTLEAAR